MNAKHKACMNRRFITLAAALCIALPVLSQNYQRIVNRNLWNDGSNITGIRQDTASIAFAELSGTYTSGAFRDYSDPVTGWTAGASSAAVRHLEKFSLAGGFSFVQTQGKDMCGSMFIEPGKYPVDIFEFTPGTKSRQSYAFDGGISVDLSDNWRAGAVMEFESQNYSKRKDLRYVSYALDMSVRPALMYHNGDFAVGLNYVFRKSSEAPQAEQIGTTVASYDAFIDKGLYYGVNQIWTGSGVHLNEAGVSGFPVRELTNGIALQASWKELYADFEYDIRSGEAGEKQFIWYRFPGYEMKGRISWKHDSGSGTHYLRLSAGYMNQDNNETVLEKVTEGGVTTVTDHGYNRLYSRAIANAALRYEIVAPMWSARIAAGTEMAQYLSSAMYPFKVFRKEALPFVSVGGEFRPGRFELRLDASAHKGSVSETDSMVSDASGVVGNPFRMEAVMRHMDEYRNAMCTDICLALRYCLEMGLYVEADAGWTHAFGLEIIDGSDRTVAGIRIGYEF